MVRVELIMPKMGESIMEGTILQWVKKVGDRIELDETVLEISTDKVDSEVPSPVEGTLKEILFQPNDVVAIGQAVAIIEVEGSETVSPNPSPEKSEEQIPSPSSSEVKPKLTPEKPQPIQVVSAKSKSDSGIFFSPLVRNMAKEESIPLAELEQFQGSGKNGRVTKADMLNYIEQRKSQPVVSSEKPAALTQPAVVKSEDSSPAVSLHGNVEIIEMTRMRKLIAKHMVDSRRIAAHVTSFIEVDVTPIVEWRNVVKNQFIEKYNEKVTYTPIFIDAVIQGIKSYPMINSSLSGDNIILKKDINIGMATAMENGNLIVPVIKNADYLNLVGMAKTVNDLAKRARSNTLKPDEIQGGTFTLTNVGTFGSMMGTPIINQPQVAILAVGAIKKKPVVLETSQGDVIGIRHMMIMSLSYDHRIVDGALGSLFLKKVGDTLESFTAKEI